MSDFGANVRRMRKERELTVEELAELAQLSPSQLSRIENNHSVTNIDFAKRIADALGVTVDSLIVGSVG